MADSSTNVQQTVPADANQQSNAATPPPPQNPVQSAGASVNNAIGGASQTAGAAMNTASQTAGAAVAGAQQAAAQAQQSVAQAGAQAQQAATQVSQQAQQLAGQAGQTAVAAQGLMKDLLMPKKDQPKVGMEDKVAAFFGYMPLVCFLVLLLKPKSEYVALHGRQGLVLTAVFFISILIIIVPFIGAMLSSIILLAWFILSIYSAYQALIGNWWKIPVIGDLATQIPITFFAAAAKEAITGQIADQSAGAQVTEVKKEENTPVQAESIPPTQPPAAA